MKKNNYIIKGLMTGMIALLCNAALAQTSGVDQSTWLRQMADEEKNVTQFVSEQMAHSTLRDSFKKQFVADPDFKNSGGTQMSDAVNEQLQGYYRDLYFQQHPDAKAIYNPGRISMSENSLHVAQRTTAIPNVACTNGDFESGNTSGYFGYKNVVYSSGMCNFVPTTSVSYSNVGFSDPANFTITNHVPDPYVSALMQTHNGSSHAMRINSGPDCPRYYLNMLQKPFTVPVSGAVKLNFSYALVMQNPANHGPKAAFFVARVLNSAGVEVGSRFCWVPGSSGMNSINSSYCGGNPVAINWKDWDCASIQFNAQANSTYTLEFFVSGCGYEMHYSYAYVDDICASVTCCNLPAPQNLKCQDNGTNHELSWDPVPGAQGYRLVINLHAPTCCNDGVQGMSYVFHVSNTDTSIGSFQFPCFSWTVSALCDENTPAAASPEICSCFTPPPPCKAPVNVACKLVDFGNIITWDAVPGAIGYRLIINEYDPSCCRESTQFPQSHVWNVSATDTFVSGFIYPCYSFAVETVCANGTISVPSNTLCACMPPPPPCVPPTNLACKQTSTGSLLSWDPVPGAMGYKLIMSVNDPSCCGNTEQFAFSVVWNVSGTDTLVPTWQYPCFSWKVVTLCDKKSYSPWSDVMCSCSPVPCLPPANLYCRIIDSAAVYIKMSWDQVPGAQGYIFSMTENDPACCPSGTPNTLTQTLTDNSIMFPTSQYGCFSWMVAVICADGTISPYTAPRCSYNCPGTSAKPGASGTGISSELANTTIRVTAVPNPASDYIDFSIQRPKGKNQSGALTLLFYDMNGKKLLQQPIESALRINVAPYASGMYFYEVKGKDGAIYTGKIVINKN